MSSDHQENSSLETNDTPTHPIVKEQTRLQPLENKATFSVQLKGYMLFALEEYARENNISNANAFRDLLEFRLFQLGKLPPWWYERGGIHR